MAFNLTQAIDEKEQTHRLRLKFQGKLRLIDSLRYAMHLFSLPLLRLRSRNIFV